MGLIRFIVHPAERMAAWPEVYRGYLSGADGRIFPTRIEVDGAVVAVRRSTAESSKFHVAWPVPGFGRPVLHTASLPEREQPYQLVVELARGELVQLRNQAANWELVGMQIPAEYTAAAKTAHHAFGLAAGSQHTPDVASGHAEAALIAICQASDILCTAFTAQALHGRLQRYAQLPVSLACGVTRLPNEEQSTQFLSAFNAVSIPIQWTQIEQSEGEYDWSTIDELLAWAETHKLIPHAGPLVDLGPGGLPEWLGPWEQDLFNLQCFVCDFVETVMSRYLGRIRLWDVVCRLNTGGALTLNEEARLSLAARVIEVARQVDEEAQLILKIDQPWGEYQARGQHRLSPAQLADALNRSGVGLAGVNLEIAVGYRPRGSAYRSRLEFSRLIDQWSTLGVPLHVTLASPSEVDGDPLALPDLEVDFDCWPRVCNPEMQAAWLRETVPLLLAKPAVASVTWSTLTDAHPHEFPHSGLFDATGQPKPGLQAFVELRQQLSRKG